MNTVLTEPGHTVYKEEHSVKLGPLFFLCLKNSATNKKFLCSSLMSGCSACIDDDNYFNSLVAEVNFFYLWFIY
jgi:hypothetical protein